jgi:hypothetical protein
MILFLIFFFFFKFIYFKNQFLSFLFYYYDCDYDYYYYYYLYSTNKSFFLFFFRFVFFLCFLFKYVSLESKPPKLQLTSAELLNMLHTLLQHNVKKISFSLPFNLLLSQTYVYLSSSSSSSSSSFSSSFSSSIWKTKGKSASFLSLIQTLLTRSSAPFMEFIREWVFRGELRDPFDEFMIGFDRIFSL